MNKINFDNTGGFPLGTYTLDFMQNSYALLNALGNISGELTILAGCEQTGKTISDGVVFINGEVLPFKGNTLSEKVVIIETPASRIFKDGQQKAIEFTRYATFGNSISGHLWADFKRPLNTRQIEAQAFTEETSLLKRLERLEERVKKTVPIGLVAIWDRPANEIPEGWVEHTELQGNVPVGYKADDKTFGRIGTTVGNKSQRIEQKNLPNVKLNLENQNGSGFEFLGVGFKNITDWHRRGGEWASSSSLPHWGKETGTNLKALLGGNNEPISILQPSRIVKFIRFVGLN